MSSGIRNYLDQGVEMMYDIVATIPILFLDSYAFHVSLFTPIIMSQALTATLP
jgi:hypothetical protein